MSIFKSSVAGIMLAVLSGLNGCAGSSRNVPLTHFSTMPAVQINWPKMVLTIPHSVVVSELNISPNVKIEGDDIIVQARYVRIDKPEETTFTFDLAKLGIAKEKVSSAKVYWLNPDGTKKELVDGK
jgi:hypothetical protein